MPTEIEAKMQIPDLEAMAATLRANGAVPVGEFLETNSFYDTEDRALLAADEGLRLRVAQNLKTGQIRCTITHKGPNAPGQLKTREETELEVSSADAADELLQHLGYVRYLSFQKRRRSWKLESCKIELDEVPCLGSFIEIEGPSGQAILSLRQRLGLSPQPLIKSSYIAMLSRYLQEHGLATTAVNFPAGSTGRLSP